MKRVAAITILILGVTAFAVFGTGAGNGDSGNYKVRAEFLNAFTVIPGLDVKIAGVKVGKVESLDVTPRQTAAVVLRIDKPGFNDFRKDATCQIRPQSLIGEKFVECTPTQPRPQNAPEPPPLPKIQSGAGKGQYFLPASQTSKAVDIDLLNNVLRLPYRQRLSIIINEFGAGLAGRGGELKRAIRNANPALQQTDRVLQILARQNRVLADLAKNSDTIFIPLAKRRVAVADFIVKANNTAQATAEKRSDFEQNFAKLPAFLQQLKPTMTRLGVLSDEMTPVLTDLGANATAINRMIIALGPFSKSANLSLTSLGKASVVGDQALQESKGIIQDLQQFTTEGKPLAANLKALLTSAQSTGGIERLMDYLFYQVAAINGFDTFGHYLRALLIVNPCSTYQINAAATPDCSANFQDINAGSQSARAALNVKGRDPVLARTDAVLRGMSAEQALALSRKSTTKPVGGSRKTARTGSRAKKGAATSLRMPTQLLPGQNRVPSSGATKQVPAPQPSQPADTSAAPTSETAAQQGLLDYLLGG